MYLDSRSAKNTAPLKKILLTKIDNTSPINLCMRSRGCGCSITQGYGYNGLVMPIKMADCVSQSQVPTPRSVVRGARHQKIGIR